MTNEVSGESTTMTLGIITAEDSIIWSLKVEMPGSSLLSHFPLIDAREESSGTVNAQTLL